MNLILIESDEVDASGRVVLADRRASHVSSVLRAAPGDRVRIGVIRGPLGTGEILSVGDGRVEIAAEWSDGEPRVPAVDLILAVPRPKALGRVLEAAASMGVGRIDLVNAWRVDKSYLRAQSLEPAALRAHLILGCEQGSTTWVPDIEVHRLLMPFLRGVLPGRVPGAVAIIAHPRTATQIEDAVRPGCTDRVIAAIGPERGWIDKELGSFAALGFAAVGLGERVFRVETAVAALLAQIELLRRL